MLMRIMANPNGNYLRARGEYVAHLAAKSGIAELPPRTRRIPFIKNSNYAICGTTSAHAENTNKRPAQAAKVEELPPRTRRIHTLTHLRVTP